MANRSIISITVRGEKVALSREEAKDIFYQLRPEILADAVRIAVEDEGQYHGLSKRKIKECAKSLSEDIESILNGYFDDAVSYAVNQYI